MLGLSSAIELHQGYWHSYKISIVITASKIIGALIHSMKFFSAEAALYLYKSTTQPCMQYCSHVWTDIPSRYLEMLDKRSLICKAVGPSFPVSLEPLVYCQNVASLSLFYRQYFGTCSCELTKLAHCYSQSRSTYYSDILHDFSVAIPMFYKDEYVNNPFSCTTKLLTSLPIEGFPLTYDLNGFNRHHLLAGSFRTHCLPDLIFLCFIFFNSMARTGCTTLHRVNLN